MDGLCVFTGSPSARRPRDMDFSFKFFYATVSRDLFAHLFVTVLPVLCLAFLAAITDLARRTPLGIIGQCFVASGAIQDDRHFRGGILGVYESRDMQAIDYDRAI